jgi:hypothetical protein
VDVRSYELYPNYLLISNSKVNNFDTETGQCFPEREGSDRTQTGKGIRGRFLWLILRRPQASSYVEKLSRAHSQGLPVFC